MQRSKVLSPKCRELVISTHGSAWGRDAGSGASAMIGASLFLLRDSSRPRTLHRHSFDNRILSPLPR
jgi:hypothetical protein